VTEEPGVTAALEVTLGELETVLELEGVQEGEALKEELTDLERVTLSVELTE